MGLPWTSREVAVAVRWSSGTSMTCGMQLACWTSMSIKIQLPTIWVVSWLSWASWLWRMLWQLGIIKVWLGFIWFVSLATRFCSIPFWFGPWVWCGHRLHDWDVNCLLFFGIYGLGLALGSHLIPTFFKQ